MNAQRNQASRQGYRLGALLLLLAGWALLLLRLNDVPPGFQHDQMFNSLDALSIGGGNYPFYFPANFGREPLGIYPVALMFKLAGGHFVWSLRFTSVLWGMLALSLTVALARRYLSQGASLLAGALLAGSFWFLFTARLGLEPAALIPLATAMIYFLNRGLSRGAAVEGTTGWLGWRRDFALAGVMGGLAIYTYLASRGLFVLLALLIGYEVLRWLGQLGRRRRKVEVEVDGGGPAEPEKGAAEARPSLLPPSPFLLPPSPFRSPLPGLLLTLLVMAAISAPLFVYLETRPGTGDLRVGELGGAASQALRGDLGPLLGNVRETALAVLWSGPYSLPYQYNVPGRPVLEPLLALFFLLGLGLTLARLRRSTEFLLLAALLVGLLPDFVTGADALHMRGVIALPLIFILVARGLWAAGSFVVGKLAQPGRDPERSRRAWSALAAVLLVLLLAWQVVDTGRAYFVDWAQAEPTQRIYNADIRAVAAYLDAHPTSEPVYIGTDRMLDLDSQVYQFYEPARRDVAWFQAQQDLLLPAAGDALYFLPSPARGVSPSSVLLVNAARQKWTLPGPGGRDDLVQGLRLSAGDVAQAVQQANGQPLAPQPVYGGALQLDEAGARLRGNGVDLLTRWTVTGDWPHPTPPGQPTQPIKLSASLVDDAGYKWAQTDQPSGLPFTFWRPGQTYLELTRLSLPADLPPGSYTVRLALYDDVGGTASASTDGAAFAPDAAVAPLRITSALTGTSPMAPYPVTPTAGGAQIRPVGRWEAVDALLAGVPADVHLSWQAMAPLDTRDLHFTLRAEAADGSVLWEQAIDPAQPLPALWPAGQVYRLTHRITAQALPEGVASAQLAACAMRGVETLACGAIGQPQIVDQPPVTVLPAPPQAASGASWDDFVTLAGYDLDQDGQRTILKLYWQVAQAPAETLERFVHAVDAGGQIVAQVDSVPANGAIPMPFWRAGEYVVDQAELTPPAGTSVAAFCVGWYQPETGKRALVRLPDGQEPSDRQVCLSSK